MLRRFYWIAPAIMLLSGCGRGSEDFTVRIDRPTDRVMQALGHGELDSELSGHFPGLKLQRTAAKNEVLYTLPGDSDFPTVIHFTFEPVEGGKATVVHAAVDVPPVRIAMKGKPKEISETKVERAVKELVEKTGSKLEEGRDTAAERKELSQFLAVLGIVTNSKHQRRFMALMENSNGAMGNWNALYDGDSEVAAPPYGQAAAGVDPGAAVREQEYREKERTSQAAAPMNDAQGESPRGDTARGSDPGSY